MNTIYLNIISKDTSFMIPFDTLRSVEISNIVPELSFTYTPLCDIRDIDCSGVYKHGRAFRISAVDNEARLFIKMDRGRKICWTKINEIFDSMRYSEVMPLLHDDRYDGKNMITWHIDLNKICVGTYGPIDNKHGEFKEMISSHSDIYELSLIENLDSGEKYVLATIYDSIPNNGVVFSTFFVLDWFISNDASVEQLIHTAWQYGYEVKFNFMNNPKGPGISKNMENRPLMSVTMGYNHAEWSLSSSVIDCICKEGFDSEINSIAHEYSSKYQYLNSKDLQTVFEL